MLKFIIITLVFIFNPLNAQAQTGLKTIAELNQWKITGRADEAARLCKTFAKKFPKQITCGQYGVTPLGRTLHYMEVRGSLKKGKNPVIWVQAGIHAGEIDGKDAVFWLLREIFEKELKPNPLDGLTLIFIPIVNLDGHERFGRWNRPNQIGPEEMGWRVTSQNYNLNRDFLKADAPEMQALIKLWRKVDPIFSLDLHVTDGAQFQPEVGLIVSPSDNHGTTDLHKAGKGIETALVEKLTKRGRMALPFYPSFEEEGNPSSGVSRYVSTPRFSQGYWHNQNRLGMLVETHSWKDYGTRVRTHHDTVLSTLEIAQRDAHSWMKAAKEWDEQNLSGQSVDLEFKHTDKFSLIDFPGYEYKIIDSKISGGKVIKFDPNKKLNWRMPFYEELKPSLTVQAPIEGYYVGPQDRDMVLGKLQIHGIKSLPVKSTETKKVQVFRAAQADLSTASFEGHQMVVVQGNWKEEEKQILAGSIFIPMKQAKGRLILQLLEPRAKDSLVSWGFFNRYFERKEYMENYVAEDVAHEMLKDAAIKKEFEERLENDQEFAKNPEKRFEFFYRKHASWDANYNMYPVFKI